MPSLARVHASPNPSSNSEFSGTWNSLAHGICLLRALKVIRLKGTARIYGNPSFPQLVLRLLPSWCILASGFGMERSHFSTIPGDRFEMLTACSRILMMSDLPLICSPMALISCIKTQSGSRVPTTRATSSRGTARSMWNFHAPMSWISRSPWTLSWSLC